MADDSLDIDDTSSSSSGTVSSGITGIARPVTATDLAGSVLGRPPSPQGSIPTTSIFQSTIRCFCPPLTLAGWIGPHCGNT